MTGAWFNRDALQRIFEYRDGVLLWKYDPSRAKEWNTRHAGKEVGCRRRSGKQTAIALKNDRGEPFTVYPFVHRLVYMLHHGNCPEIIDHINGNPYDNRIENLRPATPTENSSNRKLPRNSTTGVEGVRLRHNGRYQVHLQFDNKTYYGGHFSTLEEAALKAMALRIKHRGQWQRMEAAYY